jgi:DNA-binding transcriptional LysR family regulator
LRIGFVENAGWDGIVPETFNRFQTHAPKVGIKLVPSYTPAQLAEVQAGSLDGGFVYLFEPLSEEYCVIPLQQHDVVLAVPRKWGLPADRPIEARLLAERPFITFTRPVYPAYYDKLISACARAGLTLRVVQEVSTETAILSLVSAGIGAAIVNEANQGRPPVQVQFLRFSDLSVPLPLAFAYLESNTNPALKRFIEVLRIISEELASAEPVNAQRA